MVFLIQIYPRSFELAVLQRISRLVHTGPNPERASVFHGQRWGATLRHCGLCRVCLCQHVPCNSCQDLLELLVLLCASMDVRLPGGFPGKDHEKGHSRGSEELWEALERASLSAYLCCCGSIPSIVLAWQCWPVTYDSSSQMLRELILWWKRTNFVTEANHFWNSIYFCFTTVSSTHI